MQMEMLGSFLAKSVITSISKEELGEAQYAQVSEAYLAFFGVIVYWLKFGFTLQKRCSI